MAKLPTERRMMEIGDLNIGESAYVVPHAMWVQAGGECFIHLDYPIYSEKQGNAKLKIKRTNYGFIVFIFDTDYLWPQPEVDGYDVIDEKLNAPVIGFGDALNYEKLSIQELETAINEAEEKENFEEAAVLRDVLYKKRRN